MYEIPEHLIIEQVEAHMHRLGIPPNGNIVLIPDGELHRYTVEGDNPSTKNGAYRIHTDGVPAWYLCDWKRDIDTTGKFDASGLLDSDRDAYTQRTSDKDYMEQVRIRRETLEYEERKRKRKAAQKAKELYEQAAPATPEHEYLKRKKVTDISDFKLDTDGSVLIPLYDAKTREFKSLQRISSNGEKRFAKDTSMAGACYTFEPDKADERLHIVCEGIATGETIYRLTGRKWRVTCAMNCNNLDSVTKGIKSRYPRAEILIGADNDLTTYAKTGSNPGLSCAELTVRCGYAKGIIIPDFLAHQDGSDWNDYEAINGTDKAQAEISRQIDKVLSQITQDNSNVAVTDEWTPPMTSYEYVATLLNTELEQFKNSPLVLSGLNNFDEKQGSFVPGMYVLGATPSLGKTTFMSQICDNMAKQGNFVLFFSLEQSRLEMVTKSLSRLTAQIDIRNAISSINIRRGNFINDTQHKLLEKAIAKYQEFSKNIAIVELGFDATVSTIVDTVSGYIRNSMLRPIVIIDYLQILQADKDNQGGRDATECVIRALKRFQVDNNLVMFVISSFNRTNYSARVDYSSFKETGLIEYSCDVLLGMQPTIMAQDSLFIKEKADKEQKSAIRKATRKNPRKVMLSSLKNRYGRKDYSCGFIYDARFDLFVPDETFKDDNDNEND